MALTSIAARNVRPTNRDYKLFDSGGLFMLVTKAGTRSWRFKYRYGGKEKLLTFGQYPEITLAAAREQRDQARAVLREGRDPGIEAQKLKRTLIAASHTTFRSTAEAWFEDEVPGWSTSHAKRVKFRLEKDVYPEFGKLPISEIDSRTILAALRKIERRGSIETAKRVRGYIFAIFERAIGECLIDDEVNPAARVAKSLKKTPIGAKQPALTDVASLIRLQQDVDNSTSRMITKLASRFLALTTVRVGVVVGARWAEFEGVDWDQPDEPVSDAMWRISAARMKLTVEDKTNEEIATIMGLYRATVQDAPPLFVFDPYGKGKSTFANHLSATMAARALEDPTACVPILVRLGEIADEQSLEGLLGKVFASQHRVPGYRCGIQGRHRWRADHHGRPVDPDTGTENLSAC